jgi:hypothetical protein
MSIEDKINSVDQENICPHTHHKALSVPGMYVCIDCGTILVADFDDDTDVLF